MEILVTGGAGFIGSNYVHHLLDTTSETRITTLDNLTYAGSKENLKGAMESPRHRFVEGDINNRSLVSELVRDADIVVNFAAESHVDRSIQNASPFVESNISGTQTLLDSVVEHGIDRYIQMSTDEVYGEIESGSFSESAQLNPRNPYAATKAGADLMTQSYHTTHDIPAIIVRASNNFGPRQHPEKLIPKLIRRASSGESLPLYGDGSNVREWLYVSDTCRAIETVREQAEPGETYNIGSGFELTNLEVARRVLDALDRSEDLISFVEDRPGHDQRYALDSTKIRELEWRPTTSFNEGLSKTIQFIEEQLD